MKLEVKDQRFVDAADGWLGLGNWYEANEELERITPEPRCHPDVLCLRWEIYAKAGKWELAAEIGKAISENAPDVPFGWIHMAFAVHELKRTKEVTTSPVMPVSSAISKSHGTGWQNHADC